MIRGKLTQATELVWSPRRLEADFLTATGVVVSVPSIVNHFETLKSKKEYSSLSSSNSLTVEDHLKRAELKWTMSACKPVREVVTGFFAAAE